MDDDSAFRFEIFRDVYVGKHTQHLEAKKQLHEEQANVVFDHLHKEDTATGTLKQRLSSCCLTKADIAKNVADKNAKRRGTLRR